MRSINTHFWEGTLMLQRVEEKIIEFSNGLTGNVHRGQWNIEILNRLTNPKTSEK